MPVIARYAFITLTPAMLIAVGATLWPGAGLLALLWLTLIAAAMDRLLDAPVANDGDHAPWSDRLALTLGGVHLVLVPLVLLTLDDPDRSAAQKIVLFLALASFAGQVSHPNAHELIHRKSALLRGIGAAVYTSVGFGHHVSAHRLVHHAHLGTPDDPNTPRPGESFWTYLPRAWRGSFAAGLICEFAKLERRGRPANDPRNPYAIWIGGAAVSLALATGFVGAIGTLGWVVLVLLFGGQVLMSDYIQHYGLQRLTLPNGRVEPVAAHHSWNAPQGFSSYLMLNAPAHSEHHMHPDRPYDRLDPQADVPTLPHSMPVMAMLALVPSAWRRVMDRRAREVMNRAAARMAAPRRPLTQPQIALAARAEGNRVTH
ncbi:alkane 1-monooxygenase [Roseicyclus marinus]|uniref:alkane 1-monooxygenase n=1 Tax=Roseicyclus marinus TaxID=2161673 RepID=UPI0024103325|nr:alkane 1-monooxygenase [Roseicyclus marinus]MDG3040743.1 alkane 1-monooxygenase [Roseicyclus marinus]